jgi:hypothetical protein
LTGGVNAEKRTASWVSLAAPALGPRMMPQPGHRKPSTMPITLEIFTDYV